MDFLNDLEDNSILITTTNNKNIILNYLTDNKIMKDIKFLSFSELNIGLKYDYTNEAINYVMNHYNVKYLDAKTYIDDTYYLNENSYKEPKLQKLLTIKEDLENNRLLIYDDLFIDMLKSKSNIYVYGYTYINKYNNYLLKEASSYIKINIIPTKDNNYCHDVYEFKTMNEEISYVAEEIIKLVDKGVDINKIYLSNYSDEYYFTIKRIFKMYGIPVNLNKETTLNQTSIGTYFINNLSDNIEELLEDISKRFNVSTNDYNKVIYDKLFDLISSCSWASSYVAIKELIQEEMQMQKIIINKYTNEIKLIDILDNVFSDDEYVFLIGFNLGSIPKFKRDEDFIDDKIKPDIIENTNEYNNITKDSYLRSMKNIKNIIITYKLKDAFNKYEESFLIQDDCFKKVVTDFNISNYNDNINKLNLAMNIDNLIKYNEVNETLGTLYNNYKIPYKTYDNAYTGIESNKVLNLIDNKINFSYSSISDYNNCPFKYLLKDVLYLSTFKQTIQAFIGSLFHYTLQECLNNEEKNIDEVYYKYVEDNKDKIDLTNKNKFFIEQLNKECHFIIETIRKQYKHSKHDKEEHEYQLQFDIERKIKTHIKGIVDKVLFYQNKVMIIDYKTGSDKLDMTLFQYGIGIQLPIYLYLLKLYDENLEVIGLYIQNILNLDTTYDPNKDFLIEKEKKLKLNGITFNDEKAIENFDDTYANSEVISGLALKQDGTFKKTSKVYDLDMRESLIKEMKQLIESCIDNVTNAKFPISPLMINEKNIDACSYCEYKDICYHKYKDYNIITMQKEEDDDDE